MLAEDALIAAWASHNYSLPHAPVAVYQCDDCGLYHLTSKGEMNKSLSEMISSGKMQKMKEAERWTDKLNRKGKYR